MRGGQQGEPRRGAAGAPRTRSGAQALAGGGEVDYARRADGGPQAARAGGAAARGRRCRRRPERPNRRTRGDRPAVVGGRRTRHQTRASAAAGSVYDRLVGHSGRRGTDSRRWSTRARGAHRSPRSSISAETWPGSSQHVVELGLGSIGGGSSPTPARGRGGWPRPAASKSAAPGLPRAGQRGEQRAGGAELGAQRLGAAPSARPARPGGRAGARDRRGQDDLGAQSATAATS